MIVVVAQRVPYPPNKGEKLRTFYHIKRMLECGYEVEVVSLEHESNDQILAQQLEASLNINVRLFPVANKIFRYLGGLIKGQAISVASFYSRPLKNYITERINSATRPLSVYLSASSLVPYIEITNKTSTNNKLLLDFMDVDSDKWRQYAQSSAWPMNWIYEREARKIRKLERFSVKHFDHTFLIADAEIELFKHTVSLDKPVTKLGNGMDFTDFYPGSSKDKSVKPVFLFTGVMDYKPNIDAVVWFVKNCWSSIKSAIPDARFIIAGMNPTSQVLSLANEADVDVTGFVDDILPYYHQASVFIAPFRLARGVQNKVLQASACKLPIVTSPMGAEGISFANQNTMYFATTYDEFYKACIDAISNKVESAQKAQNAYDAIKSTYSWENQLTPLIQALEL